MRKLLLAGGAALLLAGLSSSLWARSAGPDTPYVRVIPVKTATQTVGRTLSVCMYRGARPSPYRVVTHSCRSGAETCTAWIALEDREAEIVVATYDLEFAPVEATGPTCDQAAPPPSAETWPPRG